MNMASASKINCLSSRAHLSKPEKLPRKTPQTIRHKISLRSLVYAHNTN